MQETLKVRRLWSMGQFNSVELQDEILEIPQSVILNPKARELLYNLMILEMEKAQKDYLQLYRKYPVLAKIFPESLNGLDEAIMVIKEERKRTFDELLQELNKEQNG